MLHVSWVNSKYVKQRPFRPSFSPLVSRQGRTLDPFFFSHVHDIKVSRTFHPSHKLMKFSTAKSNNNVSMRTSQTPFESWRPCYTTLKNIERKKSNTK
jgi:hypothetical protein